MEKENCPRCQTTEFLQSKLLLIGKEKDIHARENKEGFHPEYDYQLAVDQVKEDHLQQAPLDQFVQAWYCTRCGKAFVPESAVRPR